MGHTGLERENDRAGEAIGLSLALLIGLVAALPLCAGGVVYTRAGGDSPFLWQRVQQMALALADGQFPVRWMADANLGMGYPALNYYAALPYYLAAALHLGGLGLIASVRVTQTLGFLAGSLAAYGLGRSLKQSCAAAVLTSAAFTLAPFHLVNVYVRGDSLSEFWAMGLLALCLWAVFRLRERPGPGAVALLAVSYAAFVSTHNISALLASPVIGLALLAACRSTSRRWRYLLLGAGALLLGLALSMWFWYPALAEQGMVQLGRQTTGYFSYAGHFRGLDLVQPAFLHDYAIDKEIDPFRMGLVQAAVTVLALAVALRRIWRQRDDRLVWIGFVLAALLSTLLITPLSDWLWEHVPLLDYAQFPWRFLGLQAVLAAPLIGLIADAFSPRRSWLPAAALTLLLGVSSLGGLAPDRLPLAEADITPERLMLFEAFTGNVGGTVRAEYLPSATVPRYYASLQLLDRDLAVAPWSLDGELDEAELLTREPGRQTWRIKLTDDDQIIWPTVCFAGWQAEVDGEPQSLGAVDGLGLMTLALPAGEHTVVLWLGATPTRRAAETVSLIAVLVTAGLVIGWAAGHRRRWQSLGICAVLLAAGMAWVVMRPVRAASMPADSGPLIMDLASYPYLHSEPDGLLMGDAVLADYAYNSDTLAPGEDLVIDLQWETIAPEDILQVRLMPITANTTAQAVVWATVYVPIDTSEMEVVLDLPDDIPPGVYVPRLGMKAQDESTLPIRTVRGSELSRASLVPIWIGRETVRQVEGEALAQFGWPYEPAELSLLAVTTARVKESDLDLDMTWRAEQVCTRNYALSVRHLSATGEVLQTEDLAPMSPNYPTGFWRAGEAVRVRMYVPISKKEVTKGDLWQIVLYDRATLAEIGSVEVPIVYSD